MFLVTYNGQLVSYVPSEPPMTFEHAQGEMRSQGENG